MSYGDGIDSDLLVHLRSFDTPTICNALEIATGGRRATGFTRRTMITPFPMLPPVVGFARTATLRSAAPSSMDAGTARDLRLAYYDHVAATDCPTVVVIQDLDHDTGLGAFWGEVNSKVHHALGCAGVVTNGAVRDIDVLAPDFPIIAGCITPSHAFVRIESIGGDVDIFGMQVVDGDLIHADRHGAVRIDRNAAAKLPRAIDVITAREKLILDAAARPGFDVAAIRDAMADGDDIH